MLRISLVKVLYGQLALLQIQLKITNLNKGPSIKGGPSWRRRGSGQSAKKRHFSTGEGTSGQSGRPEKCHEYCKFLLRGHQIFTVLYRFLGAKWLVGWSFQVHNAFISPKIQPKAFVMKGAQHLRFSVFSFWTWYVIKFWFSLNPFINSVLLRNLALNHTMLKWFSNVNNDVD